MKTEDIERLKSICEENGFEIKSESQSGLLYYIDKKDPWDGVEFAKGLVNIEGYLKEGEVIKISKIAEKWNDGHKHVFYQRNGKEDYTHITNVTPSTESEYVEQLKKEAFERFGEIKDGDRFDCSFWGGNKPAKYYRSANKWRYEKKHDMLTLDHFCLYNSGKWATRVPKKAKVTFITSRGMSNNGENGKFIGGDYKFTFKIENVEHKNLHHIGDFLSQQLENYLNDNQE